MLVNLKIYSYRHRLYNICIYRFYVLYDIIYGLINMIMCYVYTK